MKKELLERWKEAVRNGCRNRYTLCRSWSGERSFCAIGELLNLEVLAGNERLELDENGIFLVDSQRSSWPAPWVRFVGELGVDEDTVSRITSANDDNTDIENRRMAVLSVLDTIPVED